MDDRRLRSAASVTELYQCCRERTRVDVTGVEPRLDVLALGGQPVALEPHAIHAMDSNRVPHGHDERGHIAIDDGPHPNHGQGADARKLMDGGIKAQVRAVADPYVPPQGDTRSQGHPGTQHTIMAHVTMGHDVGSVAKLGQRLGGGIDDAVLGKHRILAEKNMTTRPVPAAHLGRRSDHGVGTDPTTV